MGGLVAHSQLREYLNHYSRVLPKVDKYNKQKLYSLREEIEKPLRQANAWYATMNRGKFRLKSEKKDLIRKTHDALNALDDKIIRFVIVIQEDEAMDRAWEAQFLPKENPIQSIYAHPLVAPYKSDDLSAFMNSSWFPKSTKSRKR